MRLANATLVAALIGVAWSNTLTLVTPQATELFGTARVSGASLRSLFRAFVGVNIPGTDLVVVDAILQRSINGRAEVLGLVAKRQPDVRSWLRDEDSALTVRQVAETLSQGALRGRSFGVLPLSLSFSNWELQVSRNGRAETRGPDATRISQQLEGSPAVVRKIPTRSLGVPIGPDGVFKAALEIWFQPGVALLKIQPETNAVVSNAAPALAQSSAEWMAVVQTDLINHVLTTVYANREFAVGSGPHVARITNPVVRSGIDQFSIDASVLSVPAPATLEMQAQWRGSPLEFGALKVAKLDCKTLPVADCLRLQGSTAVAAIAVSKSRAGSPLASGTVEQIGELAFPGGGTAAVLARPDSIAASAKAISLQGLLRLSTVW